MVFFGVFFINIEDLFRFEQVGNAAGRFLSQYQVLPGSPIAFDAVAHCHTIRLARSRRGCRKPRPGAWGGNCWIVRNRTERLGRQIGANENSLQKFSMRMGVLNGAFA